MNGHLEIAEYILPECIIFNSKLIAQPTCGKGADIWEVSYASSRYVVKK